MSGTSQTYSFKWCSIEIEVPGYGVISFICARLDAEAEKPKWKRAEQARRQGDLFI